MAWSQPRRFSWSFLLALSKDWWIAAEAAVLRVRDCASQPHFVAAWKHSLLLEISSQTASLHYICYKAYFSAPNKPFYLNKFTTRSGKAMNI